MTQLNIYAKFTSQNNVERSNTFARAVCAGELYEVYFSGQNTEINYIIAAAAILGPFLLFSVGILFFSLNIHKEVCKFKEKKKSGSILQNTKRKNLVALVLIGFYVSIYVLILDILAVNVVRTSRHEYQPELSGRNPLNLAVTYVTFVCDLLAFIFLLTVLFFIILIKILQYRWQCSGTPANLQIIRCCKWSKYENADDIIFFLFPLLLVTPCICFTSHLGYIILAWITEPSRSTTTLILYYFLFFYLFLIFQKSYKLGTKLYCTKQKSGGNKSQHELGVRSTPPSHDAASDPPSDVPKPRGDAPPEPRGDAPPEPRGDAPPELPSDTSEPRNDTPATSGSAVSDPQPIQAGKGSATKDSINLLVFFVNLILGAVYLGIAVIFIMIVYLMPLASEELFNYLFNVIQFMIVVVSTQFAYKLLAGKKFSIKRIIKNIRKIISKDKEIKYDFSHDMNIVEETSDFVASKILVPHVKKRQTQNNNEEETEV